MPRHALAEEAAREFEAIPQAREAKLTAAIWRGREADDPQRPGKLMCLDIDRITDAMDAGADIEKACCVSKAGRCPFYTQCGYQAQKTPADVPDVWFFAHQSLFHPTPTVMGKPFALIVDERMFESGLIGHTGTHKTLSLDTLASCAMSGDDGERLDAIRKLALNALRDHPPGPLARKALIDARLSVAFAKEAGTLEWRLKVDAKLHPAMTTQERKAAVRAAAINRTVRRLAMFWHAIAALVADDGPEHSGWAALTVLHSKEGDCRAVVLKGRFDIHDDWKVPTLILDATMDVNLLKPYWPTIEMTADIAITAPHQHVLQVTDKSYAKHNYDLTRDDLDEEKVALRTHHLRDLNATIGAIARAFAPGRIVAITQLAVREALHTVGSLPDTIDHGHHNNIAGIDIFKDHAALVSVGRTAPPPAAVERIAEALTGRAVKPIEGWFPKVATTREMSNGDLVTAEADEHPDPIAEAVRWQACEGELLQIIGRVRGVNRTEENPVTVVLMTSTPLPIPITKLLTAADLRPDPIDLQLALGGFAFTNPTHASRAYPELWSTREGAKSALSRSPGGWVQSRR